VPHGLGYEKMAGSFTDCAENCKITDSLTAQLFDQAAAIAAVAVA